MFDDVFIEKSSDEHMSQRWMSDIYQFIYGSLVGFTDMIVCYICSIPETWTCFENGVIARSVIWYANGCGDASSREEDGMSGCFD